MGTHVKKLIVGIVIAIATIVGSLATLGLLKLGVSNLLLRIGIESEALQYVTILLFVVIIFVLVGYGWKKTIQKLL